MNIQYNLPTDLKNKLRNITLEQENDLILNDLELKLIRQENNQFKINNNILYKLNDGAWKIVIPQQLLEPLTWACHENLAHIGPYRFTLL